MRQTRLFDWSVEISCVLLNNARNMSKKLPKIHGHRNGGNWGIGNCCLVPKYRIKGVTTLKCRINEGKIMGHPNTVSPSIHDT